MSFAAHQEIIPSSQVTYSITGNFIAGNKATFKHNALVSEQILLLYNTRFEIYEVFYPVQSPSEPIIDQTEDPLQNYTMYFLLEYKVYGEIKRVEKARLINHKLDTIIIITEHAKICFLEYDQVCHDFKILCLYNLENDSLNNGKKFFDISSQIDILYSKTNNSVIISSNLNYLTILNQKLNFNVKYDKIEYLDSYNGENHFEPSIYVSLSDFNVTKILHIYTFVKDKEHLDYQNLILPNFEDEGFKSIYLIVLYINGNCFNEPIINNHKNQNSVPNIYLTKVNLGIFQLFKTQEKKPELRMSYENLNPYSFSCFVLTRIGTFIVLSPYAITMIFEKKIINYIVSPTYLLSNLYVVNEQVNDNYYISLDLDLRGGNFLIFNDNTFLLTTSNGLMFVISINLELELKMMINQIPFTSRNESISSLNAPYNAISMPCQNIFFLSSKFEESSLIIYHDNKFNIVYRLPNLAPVATLNFFMYKANQKFVLCSGLEKSGSINFLFEKAFFDISSQILLEEIDFLTSFQFNDEIQSRFILITTKTGRSLVYENEGKNIENITSKVDINSELRILNSQQFFSQELKLNLILVVTEKTIEIFSDYLKKQFEIKISDIFKKDFTPKFVKLSYRKILLIDESSSIFALININGIFKSEDLSNPNSLIVDLQVYRLNEIFSLSKENKVIAFDLNRNLVRNRSLLVLYLDNHYLEIYDVTSFNKIFVSSIVSELPVFLTQQNHYNEGDFEISISDYTTPIIIKKEVISNMNKQPKYLGLTTPREIYFDLIETKLILSILFLNGIIVIYEVYFYLKENVEIMKMKKIYQDNWENLDFKAFMYSDVKSIFYPFKNINDSPGVLISIAGKSKLVLEIKGLIRVFEVENFGMGKNIKSFTQFSKENVVNGFCFYENGYLVIGNISKNYKFSRYGLIKRIKLEKTPVKCCLMPANVGIYQTSFYILILRETQNISINNVKFPKTKYSLILRDEENVYDTVEFPYNEIILELKFVDLNDIKKRTKYLAIGITVSDEKGEESVCNGKIILFNISCGKFVKEIENLQCKGTISLIQSIDGYLIVGEGNKLVIYSINPLKRELSKISEIDNKNLSVCSKTHANFIISGDIFESVSFIYTKIDSAFTDNNFKFVFSVHAKDNNPYQSLSLDAWIDDSETEISTGCILADNDKNVHIFLFNGEITNPNLRITECGDIYLGKRIIELCSHINKSKICIYYSATDGSIGIFKSVSKEKFTQLQTLCEFIFNHFPFRAGNNPKGFLNCRYLNKKAKNNILEFDVLNIFLNLPPTIQKVIASNVVSSKELLLSNILELK